jgi:heptosyltransferase-2
MADYKRILIVRTDRLGDVILSTPVIKNLRLAFPQSYLAFLCRPYTREVLEGNPDLDEVIIYDKYGKEKGLWASLKFSFYLRRKRFDLALILHPTNRAHLIIFLAGIPKRVGWDRKLGWLLTDKIKHTKQEGKKHELEYTLDLLKTLGVAIESEKTHFFITARAGQKIEELLKRQGIRAEDKLIVIHPSASCPSKRWPQVNFRQLIRLLKQEYNPQIAVITSSAEQGFAKELVREDGIIDLRGKLSISEIGALLKRADLFISNDSGPVHIADSLGTPVVVIFGRKDPGLSPLRWGPRGEKSLYLHKDAGCDVCLAHNCRKGFLCLQKITPDEVFTAAAAFLEH